MGEMSQQEILEAPLVQVNAPPIVKLNDDNTIFLGANNKASLIRLCDFHEARTKAGITPPLGPLSLMIAKRISNPKDKLDVLGLCTAERGAGKSHAMLALCHAVSLQLEKLTGKPASTYFTGANVMNLADGTDIAEKLEEIPDMSCLLLDDLGIGLGAREFSSRQSRGVLKILATCRVKRLFCVGTSPARTHVDVNYRSMVSLDVRIHKSCHSMGYNILKVYRAGINTWGKEYYNFLGGDAGKISYWIAPDAPKFIVDQYEIERRKSADILSLDVKTKLKQEKGPKIKKTAESNREQAYADYGDQVRGILKMDPNISGRQLSVKLGIHIERALYLKDRIKGELNG